MCQLQNTDNGGGAKGASTERVALFYTFHPSHLKKSQCG